MLDVNQRLTGGASNGEKSEKKMRRNLRGTGGGATKMRELYSMLPSQEFVAQHIVNDLG